MPPTRRTVLSTGLAGTLAALLPVPGLRRLAFAQAPAQHPILIVLHQRGGCDGLNLISPADDPDFIAARATDLRVAADGPEAGHALANGPVPHLDFRLHPAAAGMAELYRSGHLAFIHAAGLTDGTRSHFVATDMIEHGVGDAASLSRTATGWLTRALRPAGAGIAAVSAGGSPSGELAGLPGTLAVPDLGGGLAPAGGPQVAGVLKALYASGNGKAEIAGRQALSAMALIDGRLPRDAGQHIVAYRPDDTAHYDSSQDFARPLRTVAQLIKLEIGLEAATVDIGGWDTHEYQPGRFKGQAEKLSNGLVAFWNDLSAWHDRIVVVMITEFGRRLRSNKSNGTDHGRAGIMAVLGGKVRGGRFYGPWPGLGSEHLDEGVDLAVATDYRRVLTEILETQRGRRLDGVFANYAYPGPLGLFGERPPEKA